MEGLGYKFHTRRKPLITITVNGQKKEIANETNLVELLGSMGLSQVTAVVEKNGQIIPKNSFAKSIIHENDTLELVRFMGGG